jgi:tape measure domain-containing protein
MAIELATAYVQVVPSMKGVGKAIVAAFDGASETAGVAGGKKAGKGFANGLGMQGAIIGAASAVTSKAMNVIAGSIGSAVNRADQMNNFPKVMKNLGYSSEDAAASIKKISASLDGLPTTSSAMTGMVQQLAPLTSNLDEATNIALAFNNAMLAGGASTMEQENALAQLTQMMAAGKVDMQAWRSVQAAMPGQLNQVAEAMMGAGHNANDLYEAMKDGKYGFDEFNAAVVRLNGKGFGQYASFAQQAKDATQGIGTAMENVQNRVAKAVQKVVEAVGVEDIAGAINGFFSQFGRVGDAAANMVTGVKNWLGQAAQTAKPSFSEKRARQGGAAGQAARVDMAGRFRSARHVHAGTLRQRAGVRQKPAGRHHRRRRNAGLPRRAEQHNLRARQDGHNGHPQREHLHRHTLRQRRSAVVPRIAQRTVEGDHATRPGPDGCGHRVHRRRR